MERQEEQILAEQIAKEGPPATDEGTAFERPDVPVVTTERNPWQKQQQHRPPRRKRRWTWT